ncbi:YjbH domain-containing protein [Salinigranum halophilum]|uniref:YjbH domain-containing protein n=1 Tax=Salinigranum halophilum TaxID=2565931 RepID=UPI001F4150DA|nr:YjbH domain-containing protein [Salinigranum halophilum]
MSEKQPAWPEGMDAAERVRHVALTRTVPRNAGWIATEADVSRDTAVKYLSRMAEQGDLKVVETAEGTCYKPDPVTQFLGEVRDLAETHSHEELTAELRDIADEIDRWKRRYDVESLAELRQSVGDDELSAEQRRERLGIVEEWEYDIEMREAIRLAIGLKDSLTELGAGTDPEYVPDSLPQEG